MSRTFATTGASDGFTIIEVVVTIFVAATFLLGFITLTTTYNYFIALARQTSVADNLSYSYLQKYARPDVGTAWFSCTSATDLTVNTSGGGIPAVASGNLNGDDVNLPNPVSYSVIASAPYGCSGSNSSQPIRVDAQVTFGATARSVHQVLYVQRTN